MLLSISILIILSYTICLVYKISFNRENLTDMTGMIIVMSLGMLSSLVIGLILGIVYEGNLTLSTILAIILSLMVGYILGKPLGMFVTIEGMAATLMGSMMGTMLGEMLPTGDYKIMLAFMDVLYIIVVSFIFLLVSRILRKNNDKIITFHSITTMVIMVILSVIVFITAYYGDHYAKKQMSNTPVESQMHEHHH